MGWKACSDGYAAGFRVASMFADKMLKENPIETVEDKAAKAAAEAAQKIKVVAEAKATAAAAEAKKTAEAAAAAAAADVKKPSAKEELESAKESARKAYLAEKAKREAADEGGLEL